MAESFRIPTRSQVKMAYKQDCPPNNPSFQSTFSQSLSSTFISWDLCYKSSSPSSSRDDSSYSLCNPDNIKEVSCGGGGGRRKRDVGDGGGVSSVQEIFTNNEWVFSFKKTLLLDFTIKVNLLFKLLKSFFLDSFKLKKTNN